MTIEEAIELCDRMKPNHYEKDDKLRWLSELDGRIRIEILDTHEDGPSEPFTGYDENTPGDTVLLVMPPYDGLYLHYLGAQVDYYNAEYARYNNGIGAFSSVYAEYADWYNRSHTPKQDNSVRL